MTDKEPEPERKRFVELAPDRWFKDRSTSSIWLTGFQPALANLPKDQGVLADLGPAVVLVNAGEITYFDPGTLEREIRSDGSLGLTMKGTGTRKLPSANWVLVMTPFDVDGVKGHEPHTKQIITAAAGLVATICGRNAIYERVFENVFRADGTNVTVFSPVVENPGVFPRPQLDSARLNLLAEAGRRIERLERGLANRVRLGLHWYESVLRSQGTDAFLKAWIAIEVLAMPDGTDIRPVNETLAKSYGLSIGEAASTFFVGRLFGMRSRIVHNGELLAIHYFIEEYLQAIFGDLLDTILALPSQRQAERLLNLRGAELKNLLLA